MSKTLKSSIRRLTAIILLAILLFPSKLTLSTVQFPARSQSNITDQPALSSPARSVTKPLSALPATSDDITPKQADKLTALPIRKSFNRSPALRNFFAEIYDGDGQVVRGIYVPGVFALPIIQQPEGDRIFVSNQNGVVTQFQSAEKYGNTGLLAHNYLSGSEFYNLDVGQQIWIIYGDRSIRRYQVSSIHRYQKLSPNSLYSDYIDLSTGKRSTSSEVFKRFYRAENNLTLQTCLEGQGILNWGLLFIVGTPLN